MNADDCRSERMNVGQVFISAGKWMCVLVSADECKQLPIGVVSA